MNDDEENQGWSTDEMAAIEEALKEAELYDAKHPIPPGPDPRDEIDDVYTDELLNEIATKYAFNLDETRFRYWVRSGSMRFYLYNKDIPSRHPSRFAKMRKDLKTQLKAIDRFQKEFDLKTYPPREFKPWTPNPFIEQVERIANDAMKHQNADQLERDLFDLRRHHHQLETAVAEERHEIEAALEELKPDELPDCSTAALSLERK